MRILGIQTGNLAINGLLSALECAGHDSVFLTKDKVVFDAFYEFKPDIVILQPFQITDQIREAIKKFGSKGIVIDSDDPDLIRFDVKPAANIAQLYASKDYKRFFSELAYITLNDPNDNELKFIEQFLGRGIKVFGQPVPYTNYVCKLNSFSDIARILASSIYLVDYYNNLILDAWMNNCIAIPYKSNPVLFPVEIFGRYENPSEFDIEAVKKAKILDAQRWILDNNTYFHRAAELFDLLGLTTESEKCKNLSILKEIRI
jgi:hypothetical protein